MYGDGHYLTFDGRRYSFSGDCEYTLLQVHGHRAPPPPPGLLAAPAHAHPSGPLLCPQDHCGGNGSAQDSFRVVTENVPCGTTGTTCSKAIKIFLGVSRGGGPGRSPQEGCVPIIKPGLGLPSRGPTQAMASVLSQTLMSLQSYELKLSDGKLEVIETGPRPPYSIRQMGIYLVVDTEMGLVLLWDKGTSIFLRLSPEFKVRPRPRPGAAGDGSAGRGETETPKQRQRETSRGKQGETERETRNTGERHREMERQREREELPARGPRPRLGPAAAGSRAPDRGPSSPRLDAEPPRCPRAVGLPPSSRLHGPRRPFTPDPGPHVPALSSLHGPSFHKDAATRSATSRQGALVLQRPHSHSGLWGRPG